MAVSNSERIARLEGIIEELRNLMNAIENRMNSIENRMNVQIGLTVAMWVSLGGLIVTLLLRQ
jgi:tetrahydromethanopterin S-methyltransferase subunit B